jgi:Tfp pilus assembly protein PilN
MKHPFDDFIAPSWHEQRTDNRVVRIGILLVAVVSIATAAAFATTLSGWRGVLNDRGNVATRWEDATQRVGAYLKVQKDIQDEIDTLAILEQFTDGVPRSLLMWELTQNLPNETRLDDVRLETRRRMNEEEEPVITETIIALGKAPDDSSISTYIDTLSSTPFFMNVSLMYTQLDVDGAQRNFSIQMTVNQKTQLSIEASP